MEFDFYDKFICISCISRLFCHRNNKPYEKKYSFIYSINLIGMLFCRHNSIHIHMIYLSFYSTNTLLDSLNNKQELPFFIVNPIQLI